MANEIESNPWNDLKADDEITVDDIDYRIVERVVRNLDNDGTLVKIEAIRMVSVATGKRATAILRNDGLLRFIYPLSITTPSPHKGWCAVQNFKYRLE